MEQSMTFDQCPPAAAVLLAGMNRMSGKIGRPAAAGYCGADEQQDNSLFRGMRTDKVRFSRCTPVGKRISTGIVSVAAGRIAA
jgi:hypothetical protein